MVRNVTQTNAKLIDLFPSLSLSLPSSGTVTLAAINLLKFPCSLRGLHYSNLLYSTLLFAPAPCSRCTVLI